MDFQCSVSWCRYYGAWQRLFATQAFQIAATGFVNRQELEP